MKKILFCVCVSFIVSACSLSTPETTQLKVMVWNIWHGGHGESLPKDGCEDVVGVIKASEADVVLMIETYGSAPAFAEALGFEYRLLSDNLSIYSRYPITRQMTYPDTISTFNFGGVEIDVDGQRVALFDTWLNYIPDARLVPADLSEAEIIAWENSGGRVDEIKACQKAIAEYMADSENVPVVVGGDFNGHSHMDWVPQTAVMYNHSGLTVEWPVSRVMTDAGFVDSFRHVHPDVADNIGVTWLSGASVADSTEVYGRQDRIDYLYYMGSKLQAVDSEIVNYPEGTDFEYKGQKFMYPSDHGFVLTTFDLKH